MRSCRRWKLSHWKARASARANSFTLTGQNEELRSHTFAQFRGGQIKGYTLVWTPERDDQMARVLPMMQESFTTFGGTLPESTGQASQVARSALLAGLAVRRPDFSRSGFYIDATGTTFDHRPSRRAMRPRDP